MRRLIWTTIGCAALGVAAIWAATELEMPRHELASMMPDGALLYLETKDVSILIRDWNESEEKRVWLKGDDYAAFSRSRLFERLSQAGDELSAAGSITADNSFLSSVAGTRSALALYDIGNLEFVYVTRMDQSAVEATPLWQARSKFDQRTEGAAQFFSHRDAQSSRTASFAARDGWLVIGTREDLVAGVLDRMQASQSRRLNEEGWFADAVKNESGPADDLRMVLNLEKIVPSPYFRSYWVQRNITELKQYSSAVSDLHRSQQAYREDRVLLRKAGVNTRALGDVQALADIAPDEAIFSSAEASPDAERVLSELRENLFEMKSAQGRAVWTAPGAASTDNAGSASMLEERIDVAPAIVKQSDPYEPLRTLLAAAQPSGVLKVYSTRAPQNEMFVNIDRAIVIAAGQNWDETGVQSAISNALRPGLTASELGLEWKHRESTSGSYFALDGSVPLFMAIRERRLFLATSDVLLERLSAGRQKTHDQKENDVTYVSVFRHTPREQEIFRKLFRRIDKASHAANPDAAGDENTGAAQGQASPFFSGNVASLSRMFTRVSMESIEERDQGSQLLQTVIYQRQRP